MKRKSFYVLIFSMLLVFAFIASQGCGGSSSNSFNRGGGDGGNPDGSTGSVTIGGDTILADDSLDTTGNGKPDFLDFDNVSITHVPASSTSSSVNVKTPAVIFFSELKKTDAGEPDTVHVNLQAGKEYTVEFSKNFADSVTSLLPLIEIFPPSSNEPLQYYFEEDDESVISIPADKIQLSVYPQEEPSLICMTFTPSVTGEYTIKLISQIRPDVESDDVSVSSEDTDTSCVMFIYEELRNENGEPGYYTRFKFTDDVGNTTDTLDICDIIQMRKLYLSFAPDYLTKYYGESPSDTPAYEDLTEEQIDELFEWFYIMQEHKGLYYDYQEDTEISSSASSTVRPSAKKKAQTKAKIDLKSDRTGIDTTVSGLRYDESYGLGNGFFGVTGYPAVGHAINKFTLPVPEKKSIGGTNYKADFISSQQEQENFSKTTAGIGFSLSGFGLKASLSHMSSYKFGITSTTFVIHYDVLERQARQLDIADYELTEYAEEQLEYGYDHFRNLYGDYFVAGYTYGGTYDAYISITTETVEQLKEIKSQLRAQFQTVSLDAKVANQTKEILNKYKASVSIEIRTSGLSASSPNPRIITPSHGRNNVDSVSDVISELQKFRTQLAQQSPADFAPVGVILQRYTLLGPVLAKMVEDGEDGTIPISPDISVIIQNFNRSLRTLGAYYQVIGGLDDSKIDAEVRDSYHSKYMDLYNTVRTDPQFYDDLDKVAKTKKAITELSKQLKATGDRYVFYKMLIASQERERQMINKYKVNEDNPGSEYVTYHPFGGFKGGSTGYKEFHVSNAVTNDIKAGKSQTLNGVRGARPGWNYWGPVRDHTLQGIVDPSYTAETSKGGTDALFCFVSVSSGNYDSDRHRRFQNAPVAGKSRLDFDFTSGHIREATWTVIYQTMQFDKATYPFFGLER